MKTRIQWLDRRIVRKQLDIMPTCRYVENQGRAITQSRENDQKPPLGNFSTILRSDISKLQIFLKNRFHSNWRSYLVLTSGQKPSKSLEPFLRKISKYLILSQFGDLFANIPKSKIFVKNLALWLFYLYSTLTSCKKSVKSLEPFLRKLCYQPTNQPTN